MARTGITYHDVEQEALQLSAQGKTPTIELIRRNLGTGSSTTIAAHLRTWKAKQSDVQRIATKEKIPENLIAFIKGLWEKVMEEADKQIAIIQQTATQEATELKQQLQNLTQENQQLQQQNQQAQQTIQKMANEHLMQEQAIIQFQNEITALQTEIKGFNASLAEKDVRIVELQALHQKAQGNLEHYREAANQQRLQMQQQYESQIKHLEELGRQYLGDNHQLKKQAAVKDERVEQLYAENTQLRTAHQTLTADFKALQAQITLTNEKLRHAIQNEQSIVVKYQAECEAHEEKQKLLGDVQNEATRLTQKLLAAETQLEKLTTQNHLLVQDKWQLGQETAQLKGQLKQVLASSTV